MLTRLKRMGSAKLIDRMAIGSWFWSFRETGLWFTWQRSFPFAQTLHYYHWFGMVSGLGLLGWLPPPAIPILSAHSRCLNLSLCQLLNLCMAVPWKCIWGCGYGFSMFFHASRLCWSFSVSNNLSAHLNVVSAFPVAFKSQFCQAWGVLFWESLHIGFSKHCICDDLVVEDGPCFCVRQA